MNNMNKVSAIVRMCGAVVLFVAGQASAADAEQPGLRIDDQPGQPTLGQSHQRLPHRFLDGVQLDAELAPRVPLQPNQAVDDAAAIRLEFGVEDADRAGTAGRDGQRNISESCWREDEQLEVRHGGSELHRDGCYFLFVLCRTYHLFDGASPP